MKKKKFPVFILCSLLTLTNIQTPWAFSDEAPDDPVFSDESVDDPVFPVELPDDPAFSDEITPDEATYAKDTADISASGNSIPITADSGFADPVFQKWISENIDTDRNGLLSDEEISMCTEISIPSMSVDSLEGIEYFYNLKTLDCSDNELLFLDVSANTVLKSLNCSHNNLLSLDLSSCKKLKDLDISFNNCGSNSSISLPKSFSVEKLNISSVVLDDFDFSRFSRLKELDCSNCNLRALKPASMPSLEKLICSGNLLDTLNLSRLSGLKYLDCSSNSIQTLKLPDTRSLNTLYCQNNLLTKLNLSGFLSLKKLNCSDNKLLEPDLRLINGLSFAFKKQGFELNIARTLKEAEELWTDGKYDLLVLDVSLPDGSGFEFCKRVRLTSKVPIIFLTASDEETSIIMGLDIGGDDYITKPFKLGVLVSRINALLRRANSFQAADTELQSNGIKVLLLQGQVFKNGELLDLTAAEYKLLCLFMRNPSMVLTKGQILDKLWDCDGNYIDSSTLTVYMRRLRMKIEDNPSEPQMLLTVRGMGYKWNIIG